MGIAKEDIQDADIVDAVELASDGTVAIVTGIALTSTTNATKRVVVNDTTYDIRRGAERLEAGDRVSLTGTIGGADGTYTVAGIVDAQQFDVVETIATSTGGTFSAFHPVGAAKVGLDSTAMTNTSADNVQEGMKDLSDAIDGLGGVDRAYRRPLLLMGG